MNILRNTAILKQILLPIFALFALYTNIVRVAIYISFMGTYEPTIDLLPTSVAS